MSNNIKYNFIFFFVMYWVSVFIVKYENFKMLKIF